jgi:hypothetical protein
MMFRAAGLAKPAAVSYSERARIRRTGIQTAHEHGQAMTEYVIILFGAMLMLLSILGPMADSIQRYMKSIYFCVSLPYP